MFKLYTPTSKIIAELYDFTIEAKPTTSNFKYLPFALVSENLHSELTEDININNCTLELPYTVDIFNKYFSKRWNNFEDRNDFNTMVLNLSIKLLVFTKLFPGRKVKYQYRLEGIVYSISLK